MRKNKKRLIAILLVLSLVFVGLPALNATYSDTSLQNLDKYSSLLEYIDATSELLAEYPSPLTEEYLINVETDVVYDENGIIVEDYDETIEQALEMSVQDASEFLTENQYKVKESDKFTVTVDNIYQSRRIIIETDEPLTTTMGAVKALNYYDEYILQYPDEQTTIEAYKYFQSVHHENLYLDIVVSVDDDVDEFRPVDIDALSNGNKDHYSWGVATMGLDIMQDNLEAQTEYELPEIIVAVLDTGVRTSNKYLEGRLLTDGYNFVVDSTIYPSKAYDYEDDHGHGTHVTGIVCDGTSSNVKILPLKVLGSNGNGSLLAVKNGLLYAMQKNASVANMSLSAEDTARTTVYLDSTFQKCINAGCIPVVSAGNENDDVLNYYPSRSPYAITIASIASDMTKSSFSNFGESIDFALPGTSIISAYEDGLAYKSGTSMAAPHGTAAVALLKTWKPDITFEEVVQILADNCVDLGEEGRDDIFGYGCINLANFDVSRGAHHHAYVSNITKQPTCTEPGVMTYTCPGCGDSYTESIPATGHDFAVTVVAPTCQAEGYTKYSCKNCDEEFISDKTPMVDHKLTASATVPATCTKDGFKVSVCSYCGQNFTEVIKATGHTYESAVTQEPTHENDGIRTYTCSKCGDSYTETIPKIDHTFRFIKHDPTCEEGGYDEYICDDCGYTYTENPVEALGHDYQLYSHTDASCTAEGVDVYKCSRCDSSYEEKTAMLQHEYVETVIRNATCTEKGLVEYKCKNCNDSYTEETPSLGHNYETIKVDPTCIADGYTLHKCSRCQEEYKDEIVPAIGHNYKAVTTPATCTQDGKITYTCENCKDTYSQTIPSPGHQYVKSTHKATCTENGYYEYTCSACEHSYIGETIPALGHNYVDIVVPPTCSERGYTRHECSRCDSQYIDSYTDVTSHVYSEVNRKDATCLEDGFVEYKCTGCDKGYTETLSALGHDYKITVVDPTCTEQGYTLHKCSRCEDSFKDNFVDTIEHEYEAVITKQPTHTEDGEITYTCKYCKKSYTDIIPKSDHEYDVEVIAPTCEREGYTLYTCKDCGYSYKDNFTDKVPHEYESAITKEPTCKDKGEITYTCKHCGSSYTEPIETLKHEYEETIVPSTCKEQGYTLHTCKNCGDSFKDNYTALKEHKESEWIIDKEATCKNEGSKHKECTECHETLKTEVIPKSEHHFIETIINPTKLTKGYTKHTCQDCGYTYKDNYTNPTSSVVSKIYEVFSLIRDFFSKP